MIYSVWNHAQRVYEYYDAPNRELDTATSTPVPQHLSGGALGVTPERAAWALPADARPIGTGKHPRGMIATRKPPQLSLGFIDLELTINNVLLWGALGFVIWKYVLPTLKKGT